MYEQSWLKGESTGLVARGSSGSKVAGGDNNSHNSSCVPLKELGNVSSIVRDSNRKTCVGLSPGNNHEEVSLGGLKGMPNDRLLVVLNF